MLICVSANPAIDKRLMLPSLVPGQVLRARAVQSFPGGKGAHVAMVLRTLGEAPHWIGTCGGATGAELAAGLSALGIHATPCPSGQTTRTNMEIIEDGGCVTEILEPGTAPSSAELHDFEKACAHLFAEGRERAWVIFSGSLPAGAPADLYARLIVRAGEFGCRTLIDTSGEPLRLTLAAHPDFVKPNREEAAHLLGAPIGSLAGAAQAIRQLMNLGARSAALSLGAEGLLYCCAEESKVLFAPALSLRPRSTVGCGDSALAGFAHAMAGKSSPEEALRLAAACAAANCVADSPGAARLEDIQEFRDQISVQLLSPRSLIL
jgi:1-phosphofructokinase family hexose kinase